MSRFTVRWRACWHASPRRHDPSGRDVDCRIGIGVHGPSATVAFENRLALAILGRAVPALGAGLGRECSRNSFDPTARFFLQPADKSSPATSQDSSIELRLSTRLTRRVPKRAASRASQVLDAQILDPDDVESAAEIRSQFLDPVLSPVDLFGLDPSERVPRALSPVRPADGSGQPSLQPPESTQLVLRHARAEQVFPRREGRRIHHSTVDTDHFASPRPIHRRRDHGKGDEPPACCISLDPVRLRGLAFTTPPEADPPGLRHQHLAVPLCQPTDMARPECDYAEALMPVAFTPTWTARPACPPRTDANCEVFERLLLNRARPASEPLEFLPCLGQLTAVLREAWTASATSGHRGLFDGKVPHEACVSTMLQQNHFLLGRRIQTEPRHTSDPERRHRQFVTEGDWS